MGVTDVYSITVDGVKDFKSRLASEERARRNWGPRWGWMIEENLKASNQLKQLMNRRCSVLQRTSEVDKRTTLPMPNSVNHEYGWLASRPAFALDTYASPGLCKLPKEIPNSALWEVLDKHTNRGWA